MEVKLFGGPHADRAEDSTVADQRFEFPAEIVALDPVDLVNRQPRVATSMSFVVYPTI
jgi:hypothetical protein